MATTYLFCLEVPNISQQSWNPQEKKRDIGNKKDHRHFAQNEWKDGLAEPFPEFHYSLLVAGRTKMTALT